MKSLCSSPSSNGGTTAGCISSILRRILCFSNLKMCSFDHFNEEVGEVIVSSSSSSTTSPGLMARLMGLESLPPINSSDSCKKSSCRIAIPDHYQELEDEHFFILSFERKKKSSRRKSQKQSMMRENLDSPRTEGESENSSPNSVLEFVGFEADQESGGQISRLSNSKMRRPLSDELESCGDSESREREVVEHGKREKNTVQSYVERWDEIGEMAAMETVKSSWEVSENRMEIGREIELSILDQLLNDLLINF